MKNMVKEVAIEVIKGFEEDGVEITLKAVVNNNNLVPFNGYKLKTGVGNCSLDISSSTAVSLKIIGNGYFSSIGY